MKIVFDSNSIGDIDKRTGVGNYAFNLINEEIRVKQNNDYLFFFNAFKEPASYTVKRNTLGLNKSIELFKSRIPNKIFGFNSSRTGLSTIPIELLIGKIDILHVLAPVFYMPRTLFGKVILTVHDLTFLKFSEYHHPYTVRLNKTISKITERSDFIIADSFATKRDLVEILKVPEDKIGVVYLGVDKSFKKLPNKRVVSDLSSVKINGPYLLFIGTLEPRKNIERLIKAYNIVRSSGNYKGKLVIAGRKGWKFETIFNEIKKSKFRSDITYIDYLPEEKKVSLLCGADILVYPSLYEGFGLPILEAMACGTPVVTSKISSMPEVGGDAAYYVDPYSVKEIADAIAKVTTDKVLSNSIIRKGFNQVKKFTWEKTARDTLEIYKKILSD